ncbi:MAG: hypothetical protein AAF387_13775 [Pseudomonadota bacterium]
MSNGFLKVATVRFIALTALFTTQCALAITNSATLDFTFMLGFSSATSDGGLPGDETDNIEIEIPDGFNNSVFDAPRNGPTSYDVSHTLGLGGPSLEDFDAVAAALDPNYLPGDQPPLYFDPFRTPASGPNVVVQGTANATAASPAANPALNTTILGDESTFLYGYYQGSQTGAITLAFDIDMAWSMLLENNASHDGRTSARISVELNLRNDSGELVDSYRVTSCTVCGGEPPSLGNTQMNQTVMFNQDTSGVGGPINVGPIELVHPTLGDDGYFEFEIATEWSSSAIIEPVPIPAPFWRFGSGLLLLFRPQKRN